MSITFRTALTTIALCAIPSVAAANAHRLVIQDFDGPTADADAARAKIMAMLDTEYDFLPAKCWTEARLAAEDNAAGPAMWLAAARESGVDTVITGWVQPEENGPSSVTVQVMEAASGLVIDTLSVSMTADNDLSEVSDELHTSLEEVLGAVDNPDSAATDEDDAEPQPPADPEEDLNTIFPADVQLAATPHFDIEGFVVSYRSLTFLSDDEPESSAPPTEYPWPPAQPDSADFGPNLEIEF